MKIEIEIPEAPNGLPCFITIDGEKQKDVRSSNSNESLHTETVRLISLFEQIKWERDCAIEQLEALGTTLGEKPEIAKERIYRRCAYEEFQRLVENK